MEELPSHMGGRGAIYKRRLGVGTLVDIFQILIKKVGGTYQGWWLGMKSTVFEV